MDINKEELMKNLLIAKFMLLITPSYKRQKHIDRIDKFVWKYISQFHKKSINAFIEKVGFLTEKDCNRLYSDSFSDYKFLKFGKTRLEVDNYNPEDCRTFQQFNDILRLAFLAIDYEENLND